MPPSLSRARYKGRKESGSFVAVPHTVLNHPNYLALSPHARMLLFDLYVQFKGSNNGDFSMPWSAMAKRGWKSKGTLNKAKKELLARGLIVLTRQGGRHCCCLYAVTWKPIDECGGKLEAPPTRVAPGNWKNVPLLAG